MAIQSPNCIVLNERTGMTHYATCDHEGKIIGDTTWCGKKVHDNCSIMTQFLNMLRPRCKVCDSKERNLRGSSEHWLHVEPTNPW